MKEKIRKLIASLAILAAVAFGGIVSASPAQAAQSDCPTARLCFWPHINYGGSVWVFNINTIALQPNGCMNMTASANNTFTSMWANVGIVGSTVVRIYDGSNCTGFFQRVYTNTLDPRMDIDAPIILMHDALTSIQVTN